MNNSNIFKFNADTYLVNDKNINQLTYISTFVKGKHPNLPDDYRFIMKDPDGKLIVLWFQKEVWNEEYTRHSLTSLDSSEFKRLTATHFKNKNYNYYYKENKPQKLHDTLTVWLNSDPLVHRGNYVHSHISTLKHEGLYKPVYSFEGVNY